MKSRKTVFVILGIIAVTLLAIALSYVPYLKIYQEEHYATFLLYLVNALVNLLFAAAFCLVVWFMFIKNPGDKVPFVLMLVIGLLGLALVPLFIYAGLYISAPWLGAIYSQPIIIMCPLYVAFGIAGLFTKHKV